MVSIVIPACNEEKRIKDTISDLRRLPELKEIIVVCNGCTDRTAEIAENMGIGVIKLQERNKGRAVLEGFKATTTDIIGFVDADGTFGSEAVQAMLSELTNNDLVIASKWKDQNFSSTYGSFGRKLASRMWNALAKLLLGLDFSDTQAGLKIMRKDAFNKIDTNFVCTGFAFDIELLYKIKKAGGTIKEVYVPIQNTNNNINNKSSFSVLHTPSMFADILKLWLSEKFKRK